MITIRQYRGGTDDAALHRLEVELQDFERTVEPGLPAGAQMADAYIEHLFACCAKWQGRMFVAEHDGVVVGFVCVYGRVPQEELDESPDPYGFVSDLVVMPAHRNTGIGQRLLAAAESYARECGVTELKIGVLQRNGGALRLYERLGFRQYRIELTKRLD
jgi:ribosomal protein S18 acetylase RimI-like enzyme